jgi:CBS domain-containing protein
MKLSDLLAPERVRVPLEARTASDGFTEISRLLPEGHRGRARLVSRDGGEPSPSGRTRILFLAEDGDHDPLVAVGIAPRPLELEGGDAGPRILVLVEGGTLGTEGRQRLRAAFFPAEVEEALLRAGNAAEVLGIRRLTDVELRRSLRVEDVMAPLSYRIYPDTPVDEVLDLIARRRLDAVPVVDERLQVLGVISAADALQHALRRRGKGGGPGGRPPDRPGPTAREIMTRSVLCVSEDQELVDAAQLMAHRDASQLPVVREGEMVGFLTRDGVLSALVGMERDEPRTSEPSEREEADT